MPKDYQASIHFWRFKTAPSKVSRTGFPDRLVDGEVSTLFFANKFSRFILERKTNRIEYITADILTSGFRSTTLPSPAFRRWNTEWLLRFRNPLQWRNRSRFSRDSRYCDVVYTFHISICVKDPWNLPKKTARNCGHKAGVSIKILPP